MGDAQSERGLIAKCPDLIAKRDGNGRFLPGSTAARPGSRLGRPNRRTLAGEALVRQLEEGDDGLPSAFERWRALLLDPDPGVRLRAEVFLFEFLHGSGRKTGPAEIPEIRLLLTPDPRPVTPQGE